jgi:hypothetical protein
MIAALLMMIPPPPPPFGSLRGNIDCLLEKAGRTSAAMIEVNQEGDNQVVLRGLGLTQGVIIAAFDLDGGDFVGRNARGETQFQLTLAKGGKWGRWWRYTSMEAQGVCYGNLYGAETRKAHFTSIASIEVN